jgi:hypothetical protein
MDIIHNSCKQPIGARIPLMMFSSLYTVAKIIVPDWGDKVESVIGLWYRPASLCSLAGQYDYGIGLSYPSAGLHRQVDRYHNPKPESNIPQSGTLNLATVVYHFGAKAPLVLPKYTVGGISLPPPDVDHL